MSKPAGHQKTVVFDYCWLQCWFTAQTKTQPLEENSFWPCICIFPLCSCQKHVHYPSRISSSVHHQFIYVKVNMTFPSFLLYLFLQNIPCIPAVLPPMTPTNTAPKVLPGNMRLSKAWPTQKSPRMTPRLHPAITCPCVPSKAGDITAGTSPKSSLIIPTDFNVLQNYLEYLPNYCPDNGEWSQVPGILRPASPSHACSCLACEADCSMWRSPPHTPPLPSPPSSLPAPITTTPSMWILWMKLSDSYGVGRGLFSKPGNVWTSGFIRDFSQSADSSLT